MRNYKSSKSVFAENLSRAAVWLIVLLLILLAVQGRISSEFGLTGKEESVQDYAKIIYWEFVVIAADSVLWWAGALTRHDSWRRAADQYSFPLSLVFCAIAFLVAIVASCFASGIYDVNGAFHKLWYVFAAPFAFLGLLYGVVPMTIRKVILPCRQYVVVRCVIIVAAGASVIWILMR